MTPHSNASPQLAFTLAAKKDDTDSMRQLLTSCPEHLSPIGVPELFLAFNEALRDNRMETVEFLLRETQLAAVLPEETLSAQAQQFGRTLSIMKAR